MFRKKGVLRNIAKYTGKHLHQSLFFNKVLRLASAFNLIKKETLAQVFSCEFCKIYKNSLHTEHFLWLLLNCIRFAKCLYNFFIYIYMHKIIHTKILLWEKKHISYYWNVEIWFLVISSLFGFCTLAMFSGSLGISGIGGVVLEAAHSIVSCCTISFRYEISFFALIGFDDHAFANFEKPTFFFVLFLPTFCSCLF